jgi:hypothetical protein
MQLLVLILTGGFVRGYRTYILCALAVLTQVGLWAVGDQSLGELLQHLPTLFESLGLATLRAAKARGDAVQAESVANLEALLKEAIWPGRNPDVGASGS